MTDEVIDHRSHKSSGSGGSKNSRNKYISGFTHNIGLKFGVDSGLKKGEKVVAKMLYFTEFIEKSLEFQDSNVESNNIILNVRKTKEYSANIEFEISDKTGSLVAKPKDDVILIVAIQNRKPYNQSIQMNDGRLVTLSVQVGRIG